MKSIVFGDGLLCMAFARPGKVQHGTVDRLPLLLQTEAVVSRATTFPAVLPICRPRQSDVDLRAAKPRVTTPTETDARAAGRMPSCHNHRSLLSKTQSLETSKRRSIGPPIANNRALITTTTFHDTSQLNSIDTRLNSPPRDTGGYVSSLWTF